MNIILLYVVEYLNVGFILMPIAFNNQVWNRPYANTAVNQAVNLLNYNSRSNTSYSLPQNQLTTSSMQNNVSGQGGIAPPYPDPSNSYANRNSCINPIAAADPSLYPPSNIQLQTEYYSMPPSFHEMSPPSPSSAIPHSSVSNRASIFEGSIDSYSNNYAQASPINESSSPPDSETFVEVLPSEITCPACILQVKHKETAAFREVLFSSKFYCVL